VKSSIVSVSTNVSQYFYLRWLINKGRYKEAEEIVKLAADVNGTPITHAFTFAHRDTRTDSLGKEEGTYILLFNKELLLTCFSYGICYD
jgi:hypothetical protein